MLSPVISCSKPWATPGCWASSTTPHGGQGADHSYTVVLGEELGRIGCGGIPMAISVQTDMATPALHRFGSHELKERYLAPAIRGDMIASIAITEPDAGSDVAALRTRAVRDGDEWVINGTKLYITNGTQADWLCLLARTSDEGSYHGMSQIVFPTDTAGFAVSRKLRKLGNWSSDTAELSFVDARVPVANTIGGIGKGFQQQMTQFQNERMIAAYISVGSMTRALERTEEYLRQRHAFGKPLIANQHVQFRLAELRAEVDLLRHYNYACAEAYLRGRTPPGSRRWPNSRPAGWLARWPTPASSSTAGWATWRRPGCHGTSGTHAYCLSAAVPTR